MPRSLSGSLAVHPADRADLHALPIFHTHGLFVRDQRDAHGRRLARLPAEFQRRRNHPDVLLRRATVMMGVPTFYTPPAWHAGLIRETSANMRLFVSGFGAAFGRDPCEWRETRPVTPSSSATDMTETNMNTLEPLRRRAARRHASACPCRASRALRCATPTSGGNARARARSARIEVQGPNVFTGYWRMPDEDRGGAPRRRLLHHRRSRRRSTPMRGYAHRRPRQGPDHRRRATTSIRRRSRNAIDASPDVGESRGDRRRRIRDFGEGRHRESWRCAGSRPSAAAEILGAIAGRIAK